MRRLLAGVLSGLFWIAPCVDAVAQELDTVVSIKSGTGLSLGGAGGEVVKLRSPVFSQVDVGFIFDGDHELEWTAGLITELEGRVSFGLNPQIKRVKKLGPLGLYGGLGVPIFLAPFTLVGVEASIGGFFRFVPRFGVVVELKTNVFFAGSDISETGIFVKLDLAVGLRVYL